MSKLIFKPEDFEDLMMDGYLVQHIVRVVNEKIETWLSENSVEVFCSASTYWHREKEERNDTHRALLVNIEELPKKECKHEPPKNYNSIIRIRCVHCGVELVANWSPKK